MTPLSIVIVIALVLAALVIVLAWRVVAANALAGETSTELEMLRAAREAEQAQLQGGPLFVFVEGTHAPTGPHADLDTAYAEAEALARAFPRQAIYLFAPYGSVEQPPVHPVWSGTDALMCEIESRDGRL